MDHKVSFEGGKMVRVNEAIGNLCENNDFCEFLNDCHYRFIIDQDWGSVSEEIKKQNDDAAYNNPACGHLVGSYNVPKDASWSAINDYGNIETQLMIIKEWDHDETNLFVTFPEEFISEMRERRKYEKL